MAFDEAKAVALLEKYTATMDEAFADSHDTNDFKFKTYNTKEEFYALFTTFMSRSMLNPHLVSESKKQQTVYTTCQWMEQPYSGQRPLTLLKKYQTQNTNSPNSRTVN